MGNSGSSAGGSGRRRGRTPSGKLDKKALSEEGKQAFLSSLGADANTNASGTSSGEPEADLANAMKGMNLGANTTGNGSKKTAKQQCSAPPAKAGKKKQAGGYQLKVQRPVRKGDTGRAERTVTNTVEDSLTLEASQYPSKKWNTVQDQQLRAAVARHGAKNWKAIAEMVPGKTHVQCLQRWKKVLQPGLIKGPWTEPEDKLLMSLVLQPEGGGTGMTSWVAVAEHIPGRTAKQCRERWSLNLDPSISREPWRSDEDALLLQLHARLGNRWAEISGHMPGRTENAVKTRFKSLLRAQQKAWTPAEDRVIVDAKATANNRWVAVASQLKGRSKNAVRQRWKTLLVDYPDLEEVVGRGANYEQYLPDYLREVQSSALPNHQANFHTYDPTYATNSGALNAPLGGGPGNQDHFYEQRNSVLSDNTTFSREVIKEESSRPAMATPHPMPYEHYPGYERTEVSPSPASQYTSDVYYQRAAPPTAAAAAAAAAPGNSAWSSGDEVYAPHDNSGGTFTSHSSPDTATSPDDVTAADDFDILDTLAGTASGGHPPSGDATGLFDFDKPLEYASVPTTSMAPPMPVPSAAQQPLPNYARGNGNSYEQQQQHHNHHHEQHQSQAAPNLVIGSLDSLHSLTAIDDSKAPRQLTSFTSSDKLMLVDALGGGSFTGTTSSMRPGDDLFVV